MGERRHVRGVIADGELFRIVVVQHAAPLPVRLGKRMAVCFCGRPLTMLEHSCGICGWVAPAWRRVPPDWSDDDMLAELEESLRDARGR